jgi:hypothetical protein
MKFPVEVRGKNEEGQEEKGEGMDRGKLPVSESL